MGLDWPRENCLAVRPWSTGMPGALALSQAPSLACEHQWGQQQCRQAGSIYCLPNQADGHPILLLRKTLRCPPIQPALQEPQCPTETEANMGLTWPASPNLLARLHRPPWPTLRG